ncbi:MAG TPA: hypothetical protein VGO22_10850 [Pseudorhizobium sp.]|jgi:hypothetical protein|nr:hypothetical protein [Pseudorhizobium sp.]
MQQEVLSAKSKDAVEANLRGGVDFCKQNLDVTGCREIARDEARILQSARDMKKIGR